MNKKGQAGAIILIGLAIILIFGFIIVAGYAFKWWTMPLKVVAKNIDTASDVIDKTYTADNAIYNYEWFKSQYEKIQANRQQIENTRQQMDDFKELYGSASEWDWATREEYNRLNAIFTGLKNQDANLVADYNARSKMANRAIFKDKLPMNVDTMIW